MFPGGPVVLSWWADLHEGRRPRRSGILFYILGSVTLSGADCAHHLYPVQCHFSVYLCGKRRATDQRWRRSCGRSPCPIFGKKDLSDLTSTIMADCADDGNGFFPLHPGAGGCLHFHGPGGSQPVLPSTGGWPWQRCGCFRFRFSLWAAPAVCRKT